MGGRHKHRGLILAVLEREMERMKEMRLWSVQCEERHIGEVCDNPRVYFAAVIDFQISIWRFPYVGCVPVCGKRLVCGNKTLKQYCVDDNVE